MLLDKAASDNRAIGAHGLARKINEDGSPYDQDTFTENGRGRYAAHRLKVHRLGDDEPTTFASTIESCRLYPSSLALIRRDVMDKLGPNPFDRSIPIFEDWEVFTRLLRFGHLAFANEVILDYRQHEGSLSRNPEASKYFKMVRVSTARSAENSPEQQKAVVAQWRATEAINARDNLIKTIHAVRERQFRIVRQNTVDVALSTARTAIGRPTRITRDY